MTKVREVSVFALGDSEKISTWSNVPYFFVRALMQKGVKVNRVDINRSLAGKVLNKTVWRAIKFLNRETTYDYFRSSLHFANVRRKIKRAVDKYDQAQANIFLTFSFSSAGLNTTPTVLFCDWTYDHQIRYFSNKVADRMERASVEREDQQIESADLVFVLFPGIADYMKQRYKNKNIFYLGNVVNSALDAPEFDMLKLKAESEELLFVGGIKYREGALALIGVFAELQKARPQLRLNIVGMKTRDFGPLPEGVKCYGYLDKAKSADRDLYYALLSRAKMVVNTTPKWGAFSATLEAMHFYTPVITSAYAEFVQTFGSTLDFGLYSDNSPARLQASIDSVFSSVSYRQMCINAHARVSDYTWDAYIQKVLEKLDHVVAKRKPGVPGAH